MPQSMGLQKIGHNLATEQQTVHKFFKAETLSCIFLFPLDKVIYIISSE